MDSLKRIIATIIAFTMISGAFLVVIPYAGSSSQTGAEIADQIPIYASEEIRKASFGDLESDLRLSMMDSKEGDLPVGTVQDYITQDMETGSFYTEPMEKRGEGNYCEVWVSTALDFASPSDIRNFRVNITDDQVNYTITEFDENIYQVMTETFIEAPELNGSAPNMVYWQYLFNDDNLTLDDVQDWLFTTNDTGKIMIMIFNIRDTSYYNSAYTGGYVAGFYWSFMRETYNRNIINIDCYDWVNRTGVQSDIPDSGHYSYVYESTVAHEYQHLLHDEMDPVEESWINEGLSMFSEYLCGYGFSYSHMAWFMATPDNSLTVWEDQGDVNSLADYGAVAMFMAYMYDHYGGTEMMQSIFTNQLQGIASIDDALRDMGYNRMNFNKVFLNWRLANLIWSDSPGNGLYNYESIAWEDIGAELRVLEYDVDDGKVFGEDWGPTYTYANTNTGYYWLDEYGTDYIYVDFETVTGGYSYELLQALFSKLVFDGDENAKEGWLHYDNEILYMPSDWWYSGSSNNMNVLLTANVDLTDKVGDDCLMRMYSEWDIEDYYDFAFVQVSTDGGLTWTSLNDTGDYCTELHYSDVDQTTVDMLPGLTGTGSTSSLYFDLSDYAGQEIMLGFRYVTDSFTYYDGWYIDRVLIDGVSLDMSDFQTTYPEQDFLVTIYAPGYDGIGPMVMNMPTNDVTEVAQRLMGAFMFYPGVFLLVSPMNGVGEYSVEMTYRSGMFMD